MKTLNDSCKKVEHTSTSNQDKLHDFKWNTYSLHHYASKFCISSVIILFTIQN
jgi:hypothetical protein